MDKQTRSTRGRKVRVVACEAFDPVPPIRSLIIDRTGGLAHADLALRIPPDVALPPILISSTPAPAEEFGDARRRRRTRRGNLRGRSPPPPVATFTELTTQNGRERGSPPRAPSAVSPGAGRARERVRPDASRGSARGAGRPRPRSRRSCAPVGPGGVCRGPRGRRPRRAGRAGAFALGRAGRRDGGAGETAAVRGDVRAPSSRRRAPRSGSGARGCREAAAAAADAAETPLKRRRIESDEEARRRGNRDGQAEARGRWPRRNGPAKPRSNTRAPSWQRKRCFEEPSAATAKRRSLQNSKAVKGRARGGQEETRGGAPDLKRKLERQAEADAGGLVVSGRGGATGCRRGRAAAAEEKRLRGRARGGGCGAAKEGRDGRRARGSRHRG